MKGYPPELLLDEVNHRLRRDGQSLTEDELVEMITSSADPNDPARLAFHIQLSRWEGVADDTWTSDEDGVPTLPGTTARRTLVLRLLGLTEHAGTRIGDEYPLHEAETVVISDTPEDWQPWYTDERAGERTFYWDAYRGVLEKKIDPYAVERLDHASREIVRRLADPSRPEPYQAKGLVVGHVQSGKTANFTGVIAKAIDAGYRLIIVLTGTIEILRSQTQRRIDMELVGEENILGGIDPANADLLRTVDYAGTGDRDWIEGRFLRHGARPKDLRMPDILRLTTSQWDFKKLQAGLSVLDFRSGNELVDPRKPLFDPVNLPATDVRIAVVKKNKTVLKRLVADLEAIHTRLGEIPTLIIDDEADQASVNTVNPKRHKADADDRSAINGLIAELMRLLTRAQYVGYTATPFANVFVDPDDSADIFPKDFIVSLEPPAAYMGGLDFHDLDPIDGEMTFANSNEKAFVRDLTADGGDPAARDAEIRSSLDAYVLAGAIKLWRENATGKSGRFRHHTMLVHESVRQADHSDLAGLVDAAWSRAGYSEPSGLRRLHDLWRNDFLPVSEVRAGTEPFPRDWNELRPHIGTAIDRISRGASPVVVVNGDKDSDYAQADLDFQARDVWKILVGGAKLSRGFTVEGLTTSYYTRRTQAADTLMQMGRWFGFRPGYKDLVRLYLGRNVSGPRGTQVDLYEAFTAIVRDEEDFRAELRSFQGLDEDGRPRVRPIDIPPMVFQSLPWLKPTGTNKMYNAYLTFKGEGGKVKDFFQQPRRSAHVNLRHFAAIEPLLDAAGDEGTFFTDFNNPYGARFGVVPTAALRAALERFEWNSKFEFGPTLEFMDRATLEGTLTEWVVLLPGLSGAAVASRRIGDRSELFSILERKRRPEREDVFSGSSPRQRRAMEIISGGIDPSGDRVDAKVKDAALRYPDAVRLHTATRGAFLLSFASDAAGPTRPSDLPDPVDPGDIATLFSLAFPRAAAPNGRIGFSVQVKGAGPVVSRVSSSSE
jgi:hypothetical protein